MSYGKIFESLFTGSMVGSGPMVFAVWSYCIANAKPPGFVEINPIILAAIIGCSVGDVEAAIERLCSPDPKSRTKDCDGRRLIPQGAFLYHLPTWQKYNQIRNEVERREQNRLAAARHRDRQQSSAAVSTRQQPSAESAHVDADVDTEVQKESRARAVARPDCVPAETWADWIATRKAKRAGPVTATVLAAVEKEATAAGLTLDAAIAVAAARGWQTFRAEWHKPATAGGTVPPRLVAMSREHIPNMPLGSASCQCQGCVEHRAKRA